MTGFLRASARLHPAAALATAALAVGCAVPASRAGAVRLPEAASAVAAQPQAAPQPPALVGNRAITWEQLQPLLAEAAGGVVLEEVLLDLAVEAELARRGLRLTPEDVVREQGTLVRSLARAAEAAPDATVELLGMLRASRGLGDRRFTALLQRNAGLRRLVRDSITITEEDLRTGYQVQFGPRHVTRVIVAPSERTAARALARVRGGGDRLPEPFGEVAAEVSTDPSAARGGRIEPLSVADPAYPAALRQAIAELQVGEVSGVVALDQGFAIVRLDAVIPGSDRPLEAVREEVEAELRLIRERAAMDELASNLLATTPLIVLDRSLEWSWRQRRGQNP